MKIMSIKLVTGEDIIGAVDTYDPSDGFINMENPLTLNRTITTDGVAEMRMGYFMPYLKERLMTFYTKNIVMVGEVTESVSLCYFEMFEPEPEIIERDGGSLH